MTGRLIVVSNRIPTEDIPSGGLVVAIHEALCDRGGIWIGAHPDLSDSPEESLIDLPSKAYDKKGFQVSPEEWSNFYLGYANSVLWPLFHHRNDLIKHKPGYASGYVAVNRRVAKMIAKIARPDDLIWVQDYHFLPLAQALRSEGVTSRIGFFLHIPFPARADLDALSEQREFHDWIAAFDLVGLQTKGDVARCLECFRAHPEGELLMDGRVKYGPRIFAVRSFPIGIDAQTFADEAQKEDGRALMNLSPREDLVIGVDRLDYSKGLPNRFRAFGRFLESRDEDDRRVTFLQIAPPTREEVLAYQDIRDELEGISGKVNGAHSEIDWTPIRYMHRAVPRARLAALYRAARVGLVTSLADGMNLVAKEYVAAQDPEDPGVLVLSRTAGAAEQMGEAVLVNPYDVDNIARAIGTAISMDLEERRARHRNLREGVMRENIEAWTESVLDCLAKIDRPLVVLSGSRSRRTIPGLHTPGGNGKRPATG